MENSTKIDELVKLFTTSEVSYGGRSEIFQADSPNKRDFAASIVVDLRIPQKNEPMTISLQDVFGIQRELAPKATRQGGASIVYKNFLTLTIAINDMTSLNGKCIPQRPKIVTGTAERDRSLQ
jgi:hypothetical protein